MNVFSVTQNRYKTDEVSVWKEEKNIYFKYFYEKVAPYAEFKNRKILDIGTGLGIWPAYIKSKVRCSIYGMEMSKESIKIAKKNGLSMKYADIEQKWPYKNGNFEVVSGVQVIEHLLDTDMFITESYRVLSKNGYLIISTPNLASWLNRIIFLFGFQPFTTEVSTRDKTFGLKFTRKLTNNRDPVGHIRSFTLNALVDMLEYYDFKVIKTVGGKVDYLPKFLKPLDIFFSYFPSLASDLIVIAKKQ